jgi:hypothetical protein
VAVAGRERTKRLIAAAALLAATVAVAAAGLALRPDLRVSYLPYDVALNGR